ncbi:hypothetical protein DM02DRAFT_539876 [Periconia macrospinosa]|uniref:Exonuclease V n=1 Tax=Periconia macrospinosa TaxID=97972 RepID=A0A2V1DAP2_9PLEO|nr:hypothetical protein DM02DRAFT_539876 [Periconia macrospinosa]
MDHESIAAKAQKVHTGSDYGSDVDVIHIAASSDYGSDIDLDCLDEGPVTGHVPSQLVTATSKIAVYPSVEFQSLLEGRDEVLPLAPNQPALRCVYSSPPQRRKSPVEIEYDVSSRRAFSVPKEDSLPIENGVLSERTMPTKDDSRTPLQRFRARRPLSVTDLISPAWCELQYWYTLTKYGRKPPTRAMKAGTKIHHALEEEVHTIVPVQVNTKEDRFGLRIWNTIQGLRCLRDAGLTRELEVWGIIEGQVINGVIDELSFTCPDRELEDKIDLSKTAKNGGTLPLGQLNIEQAFSKASTNASQHDNSDAWIGNLEPDRRIYITDVKTRGVRTIPKGASLRPTRMQLMLYRKLLESLSLNTVDAETVLRRYHLSPLQPFSDSFMMGVGDHGDTENDQRDLDPSNISDREEIRSHPNLLSLWSLMIHEFQQIATSFSDILRVEFRYSKTSHVIGSEFIVYDPEVVDAYSEDEIKWWEGNREAKGVEIEEAFKCRICDFAEVCTWRKAKIEEATEKNRLSRKAKGRSAV